MPVELFRQKWIAAARLRAAHQVYAGAPWLDHAIDACNAVHTVEQRLARWFLMAHDRVGTDSFPLTRSSSR